MPVNVVQVKIDDVKFDSSIYPRDKPSSSTVEHYVDVLRSGQKFPAIALQPETNRLWDGYHRWKAHERYREEWNEADEETRTGWADASDFIDAEYHVCPEGVPEILFAASFSVKHGDRLTPSEKKSIARKVYEDNPDYSQLDVSERLSVSRSRIGHFVSDIFQRRREEISHHVLKLSRIGWTQEEIAGKVGLSQNRVSEIVSEMLELAKAIKTDAGSFNLEDIAERNRIGQPLAAGIAYEDLDDADKMEKLDIKIQPYDAWHFASCSDIFGDDYPGRIPGQLVAHVLYFFTQPGDVVVDPMLGSGTTADVCLAMNRKCYGFDIANRYKRHDVMIHDIAKDGWHERVKKANLVFWDPPYFDKVDDKNVEDGYGEGSVSKLSRDEYLAFFAKAFSDTQIKKKTKLAFLMSNWDDADGKREPIHMGHYMSALDAAGWKWIRQIACPLSTQQVHPDIVLKFRESRRLCRLQRDLLIYEKR